MDLKSNKNEVYAASRYFIGNVVKIRSNQEEIKSNMETGGERIKPIMETEGDRTLYNVETKENGMKKCLHIVETKKKRKMYKSYADIVHR